MGKPEPQPVGRAIVRYPRFFYIYRSESGVAELKCKIMKKCTNCGIELDDKAMFCMECGTKQLPQTAKCVECGAELPSGAKFCQECGAKQGKQKIFCSNCGVELEAGAKFCAECGFSVNSKVTPTISLSSTPTQSEEEIPNCEKEQIIKASRELLRQYRGKVFEYPKDEADKYREICNLINGLTYVEYKEKEQELLKLAKNITTWKNLNTAEDRDSDFNIKYALIGEDTLFIKGEGSLIEDYCDEDSYLEDRLDKIKNVVFLPGLKDISDLGWENVETIVISEGIKEMDSYMFSDLEHLKYVNLPDSIKLTGDGPCREFQNSGIKYIFLPPKFNELSSEMFKNCRDLEVVFVPEGCNLHLDYSNFEGCKKLRI